MWGKCGAGKRGRRGVAGGRARQEKKLEYSVCREFVKGLFRKTATQHPFLDRGSSTNIYDIQIFQYFCSSSRYN